MNDDVSSVYIHIPFCKKICSYCDFCKLVYNEEFSLKYLMSLEKEVIKRYDKEKIKTIYIGGGTPSALPIVHLKKLFNIIHLFNFDENIEITFEMNLDDVREELLLLLKENNINRLSIGIESFNKEKLDFLNREAEYKDAYEKISLCRSLGFNNINIDLIYATPVESISTLKSDLKKFVKLGVEHISTYSLIIEENTILKQNGVDYINDKLDSKMYNVITKYLKRKKYNHYELSNYSKKGFESKHNLVYWNNEEYYGFGLGAAGYYGGVRYENTRNLTSYLKENFTIDEKILSKKEEMDFEIILGFRKVCGIDLGKFKEKFNVDFFKEYNAEELIKDKHLLKDGNMLKINSKKLYIMNEILIKLI